MRTRCAAKGKQPECSKCKCEKQMPLHCCIARVCVMGLTQFVDFICQASSMLLLGWFILCIFALIASLPSQIKTETLVESVVLFSSGSRHSIWIMLSLVCIQLRYNYDHWMYALEFYPFFHSQSDTITTGTHERWMKKKPENECDGEGANQAITMNYVHLWIYVHDTIYRYILQ